MRLTRWLWVLAGLFALSLLACSGGGGGGSSSGSLRLSVAGTPADARVYLNGRLVEDPRNITLTPGTHQIRVEFTLSNGQVVYQTFTITAGAQTSLQYDLTGYQIEVTPPSVEVWVDQEVQLTAVLKDKGGTPVSANWVWRSLDPSLATVSSTGRVRGVQRGSTKVVVTDSVTGLSLEIPVVVDDLTGYQIEVTPPSVEVWVDQEVQLTAVLKDKGGAPISANWVWRSLDPSIAIVDSTGRVRGVQRGSTKVVVTDTVTGLSLEIPVVVLDFPPPPG